MSEAPRAASTGVALIESIDHEGVGVAHVDGKVTFIEGGITGERVAFVAAPQPRKLRPGHRDRGAAPNPASA